MRILLIEDESETRKELKKLLENVLYQVEAPAEFTDVPELVNQYQPDLILMDLNLPGISGFEICAEIRKNSDVPVIFVTSRTDSMDELQGMLLGGDDYITKPFQPPVLLAHIAAVLKRTKRSAGLEEKPLRRGVVALNLERSEITNGTQKVDLTKNEMKILHCLFKADGKIVSRMDLIEYLWDNQIFIDDNTLSVNMTRLRSKLQQIGVNDLIHTKRGMGYFV